MNSLRQEILCCILSYVEQVRIKGRWTISSAVAGIPELGTRIFEVNTWEKVDNKPQDFLPVCTKVRQKGMKAKNITDANEKGKDKQL